MRRADSLTTFMCQLSLSMGSLTSWNPQGLSRPVMRELYEIMVLVLVGISNNGVDFSWPNNVNLQTYDIVVLLRLRFFRGET